MARSRPNGQKFEAEIERYCNKKSTCIFSIRLRTPQARLANVTNIADYLLLAKRVILLEAKETGADSFSLNTFQQKEEVEKFKSFYSKARQFYGKSLPYRVVVLVHFIRVGKYTAYFVDEGEFKVIRPDDPDCITASTLPEILGQLLH